MKRFFSLALCLFFVCAFFTACAEETDTEGIGASRNRPAVVSGQLQYTLPTEGAPIATLSTTMGDIVVVLYPDHAGWAVDNFTRLANEGYYNETLFHRVIADFIIQGGDPTKTGTGGESIWKKPFPIEVSSKLHHFSGAFCMSSKYNNSTIIGSQFYIVATPAGGFSEEEISAFSADGMSEDVANTYKQAGGAPYLDNTDTVFGQVISGMDIVDSIAAVSTNEENMPKKEILLQSITFSTYTAPSIAVSSDILPDATITSPQ